MSGLRWTCCWVKKGKALNWVEQMEQDDLRGRKGSCWDVEMILGLISIATDGSKHPTGFFFSQSRQRHKHSGDNSSSCLLLLPL